MRQRRQWQVYSSLNKGIFSGNMKHSWYCEFCEILSCYITSLSFQVLFHGYTYTETDMWGWYSKAKSPIFLGQYS